MKATEDNFWTFVDKKGPDDCWNWMGWCSKGKDHRGVVCIDKKRTHAARYAYMNYHKVTLGRWEFVCHTCDNGSCCNPAHMFVGTPMDNTLDCMRKGRNRVLRGEEDPKSILTALQVNEIRSKYIPRIYTQPMLAKEYGVSRTCIEMIIIGRTWKQ